MTPHRDITEQEWQRVIPLLPELRPRTELRGRPLANTRAVLNGVLWVMYSGATWSAMPRRYPSYQTCHRRFKAWHDEGVLKLVMAELFGEEGVALCESIETRMRRHMGHTGFEGRTDKGRRNEPGIASLQRNSPFVALTPGTGDPFRQRRALFRQGA